MGRVQGKQHEGEEERSHKKDIKEEKREREVTRTSLSSCSPLTLYQFAATRGSKE